MLNGGITLPMKESRAEIIERIAQDIKRKRSRLRIYMKWDIVEPVAHVSVGKYEQVFPITSARVPIVKFVMGNW